MKTFLRAVSTIIFLLLFCNMFLFGQDMWLMNNSGSSIAVEYLTPSLKSGFSTLVSNINMYSVVATGIFRLKNDDRIIFQIPYVHYHMDAIRETYTYYFNSTSYTITYKVPEINSGNIGNIYCAYETREDSVGFSTTFGLYLPIASDKEESPMAGAIYDFDRFALYVPNLLTFCPRFKYIIDDEKYFIELRGKIPITYLTKEEANSNRMDMFIDLGVKGGIKIDNFSIGVGWSEVYAATEAGSPSDRFADQAGAMIAYKFGRFQPEIFYRIPLDHNSSAVLKSILGVTAKLEF